MNLLYGADEMNLRCDSEKEIQKGFDEMTKKVVLAEEVEECSEECTYNA